MPTITTTAASTTATDHHRSLGDQTWRRQAACRPTEHHAVDPDLFFPDPEEMDKIHTAKALCAQCPVRNTCLDAALENGDAHGIRGGLTEQERAPLHKALPHRLDYSRVNAALTGRDIHLTVPEREAVVHAAYRHGIPARRLAWILKLDEDYAARLYRDTHRALRHRDIHPTPRTDHHEEALGRDDFGTAA